MPCDFLPIGVEGATLDAQGPDTHAECVADLLLGERTAAGDEFIGVFSVIITHESWGAIDDVYRTTSAGGTPTDLGDEGVLKTFPAVATDAYGAYFLKGPYSVSVEHTVMDPNFFVEDTALTKALTETLARAIDSSMDAAGVGATDGDPGTGVAPPQPGGTGSASDDDGTPVGPIVATTVVVLGGAAVTINVLRRRPRGPRTPPDNASPTRCWGEVAAIDEAADRLDRELDELRRARDAARDRIERIGRAIDAERTLTDGFQSYADAIRGSQGVHEAKVYSDTALVVAATFAAGAASIEMLNAAFAVEAASMSPEALAVAEQLEAGAAAARSAAQAAARLPELASRLNTAKNLASVAQGAELAAAANAEIVALEGAIASAQTTIQAGAAAADATTTLASQLARLTQSSLPAQLWARFKGVGTLFLDLATNQAVDASKAARTWLRRDDPERQRQLVEETLRAAEVQRDLVQKGRAMISGLREERAQLVIDAQRADGLVRDALDKIAELAARRAQKVAECERLAARQPRPWPAERGNRSRDHPSGARSASIAGGVAHRMGANRRCARRRETPRMRPMKG